MSRGWGTAVLAGLRSLVVIIAMGVIGVGAWALHMMHDAEIRGDAILDTSQINDGMKDMWRTLFTAATDSQMRVWIAVAAGSFTFLASLFIFLSVKIDRLSASPYLLIPLEILTMGAMGLAFATALSLALKLGPLCSGLDASSSSDLAALGMLCPLSEGYAGAAGGGSLILVITALSAIISACHRAHAKNSCSFEPTASGLGISDDYQVPKPSTERSRIPTLYDPQKPAPGSRAQSPIQDEEKGFAQQAAEMGRRDSGTEEVDIGDQAISGPLGLQKPQVVQQLRPARPWSEMPKRK